MATLTLNGLEVVDVAAVAASADAVVEPARKITNTHTPPTTGISMQMGAPIYTNRNIPSANETNVWHDGKCVFKSREQKTHDTQLLLFMDAGVKVMRSRFPRLFTRSMQQSKASERVLKQDIDYELPSMHMNLVQPDAVILTKPVLIQIDMSDDYVLAICHNTDLTQVTYSIKTDMNALCASKTIDADKQDDEAPIHLISIQQMGCRSYHRFERYMYIRPTTDDADSYFQNANLYTVADNSAGDLSFGNVIVHNIVTHKLRRAELDGDSVTLFIDDQLYVDIAKHNKKMLHAALEQHNTESVDAIVSVWYYHLKQRRKRTIARLFNTSPELRLDEKKQRAQVVKLTTEVVETSFNTMISDASHVKRKFQAISPEEQLHAVQMFMQHKEKIVKLLMPAEVGMLVSMSDERDLLLSMTLHILDLPHYIDAIVTDLSSEDLHPCILQSYKVDTQDEIRKHLCIELCKLMNTTQPLSKTSFSQLVYAFFKDTNAKNAYEFMRSTNLFNGSTHITSTDTVITSWSVYLTRKLTDIIATYASRKSMINDMTAWNVQFYVSMFENKLLMDVDRAAELDWRFCVGDSQQFSFRYLTEYQKYVTTKGTNLQINDVPVFLRLDYDPHIKSTYETKAQDYKTQSTEYDAVVCHPSNYETTTMTTKINNTLWGTQLWRTTNSRCEQLLHNMDHMFGHNMMKLYIIFEQFDGNVGNINRFLDTKIRDIIGESDDWLLTTDETHDLENIYACVRKAVSKMILNYKYTMTEATTYIDWSANFSICHKCTNDRTRVLCTDLAKHNSAKHVT